MRGFPRFSLTEEKKGFSVTLIILVRHLVTCLRGIDLVAADRLSGVNIYFICSLA